MADAIAQQVRTGRTTTPRIMRTPEFSRGFNDARSGVPFDWRVDSWHYERGRLFACIAPLTMPLYCGGNLNPKAVALCDAAFSRGLIT